MYALVTNRIRLLAWPPAAFVVRIAIGVVLVTCVAVPARAQFSSYLPPPNYPQINIAHLPLHDSLFDLSAHLLQRIDDGLNTWRTDAITFNPLGGGAYGDSNATPHYRAWLEGYGLYSRTDAFGVIPGDKRTTWGGIAGLATSLPSGMSFGVTVDQSTTDVDVIGLTLPQGGRLDMTQIAGVMSYSSGPWTFGLAGVYGTGHVHTSRVDPAGLATASYSAGLSAVLAELSYYWQSGMWRAVPKIGVDWTQARTGAFLETGGTVPVAGGPRSSERTRAFAGVEVGYSWFKDKRLRDVALSVRAVEALSQKIDPLTVSLGGGLPLAVPARKESQFGVDVGATTLMQLTSAISVYAAYNGRFRSDFRSHTGTLGADVRW